MIPEGRSQSHLGFQVVQEAPAPPIKKINMGTFCPHVTHPWVRARKIKNNPQTQPALSCLNHPLTKLDLRLHWFFFKKLLLLYIVAVNQSCGVHKKDTWEAGKRGVEIVLGAYRCFLSPPPLPLPFPSKLGQCFPPDITLLFW